MMTLDFADGVYTGDMVGTLPSQPQQNSSLGYPRVIGHRRSDEDLTYCTSGLAYGSNALLYEGNPIVTHSSELYFKLAYEISPVKFCGILRLSSKTRKSCVLTHPSGLNLRVTRYRCIMLSNASHIKATKC